MGFPDGYTVTHKPFAALSGEPREKEKSMFEETEGTGDDRESASEGLDAQPESAHPVAGEDVGGPEEGEGARKAAATPEIGDDGNEGETQRPAPDDDVGVPENPGDPKEEN
ncbi:MAG: hypothetical protein H0U14_01350 [Thermoleophilaceae bacterium]|nr:hypothetical protein [Thermoleophilaceae bacterium]